jgi:hypothetical protein
LLTAASRAALFFLSLAFLSLLPPACGGVGLGGEAGEGVHVVVVVVVVVLCV